MVDGTWDRAQWAELLAPDGTTLLDRDEDRMLAAEQQLEGRLRERRAGPTQYERRAERDESEKRGPGRKRVRPRNKNKDQGSRREGGKKGGKGSENKDA